jgi:ketosteroid isomerase-like protein
MSPNRDHAHADLGLEPAAVSQEPAGPDLEEAVRASLDALCSRDFDRALAVFHADAVMDVSSAGMELIEGRTALQQFFEVWRGPYEDFELELEEFRDQGNGVTLSVVIQRGRLPGSSSFLSIRGGHVALWRDGLVERNIVYQDVDEARVAAQRLAEERV